MSNNSYYVDFIFDEFPVLAIGTNPETGESMTFEEAKQEVIDWLERELEAVKQMQEEEHALDEMVRTSQLNGEYDDQESGRQYWEDHCS